MAENKWEMARQDYLLAKQLQGLSQRTMDDYDTRPVMLLEPRLPDR
jgi:hypothetical protein